MTKIYHYLAARSPLHGSRASWNDSFVRLFQAKLTFCGIEPFNNLLFVVIQSPIGYHFLCNWSLSIFCIGRELVSRKSIKIWESRNVPAIQPITYVSRMNRESSFYHQKSETWCRHVQSHLGTLNVRPTVLVVCASIGKYFLWRRPTWGIPRCSCSSGKRSKPYYMYPWRSIVCKVTLLVLVFSRCGTGYCVLGTFAHANRKWPFC